MCGIAGSVTSEAAAAEEVRHVGRMTAALRHRGPEGICVATLGGAVFGHSALAFVDIGHALQPHRADGRRLLVVFNGEIYNHQDLRARLERHAPELTATRGEPALLAGLFTWLGPAMFDELRGMFAIAIHDEANRQTWLARDRFGKRSLYYARQRGTLIFASELTALMEHPTCPSGLNRGAVARFLTFGAVPAPAALIAGVKKVESGTVIAVQEDGEIQRRYWTPVLATQRADVGSDELSATIEHAVATRVPSEVPMGVFLSGGLDSSLIAAIAGKYVRGPLRTFSVGFEDDRTFDETSAAQAVAKHLGTDHTIVRASRRALADEAVRVLTSIDEPLADQSLVPTVMLSREARVHVKAVLTGDGADELFMGYRVFLASRLIDTLSRIVPRSWVKAALASMGHRERPDRNLHYGHIARHLARVVDTAPERLFYVGGAPFERHEWAHVLEPETWAEAEHVDVFAGLDALMKQQPSMDALERLQVGMICHFLRDGILAKLDRATMSQSLEARCPFLDEAVADLALRLPTHAKLRFTSTKDALRRAAAAWLPPWLIRSRKRGFRSPTAVLLKGELREFMRDVLASQVVRSAGIWRPAVVDALVDDHLAGRHDNHRQLWSIVCVGAWVLARTRHQGAL